MVNFRRGLIWRMIHKRWDIELNGFRDLKTYYHADHCFEHAAVEVIFMLIILAFNLREMFLYKRVNGFGESKITKREVTMIFFDELLVNGYREFFDTE